MNIYIFLICLVCAIRAVVVEINDSSFITQVASNPQQLWMIMFGAEWCGHCRQVKPEFEKASNEMEGYGLKFGYVNENGNNQLISKFVADPHTHRVSYPKIAIILGQQILGQVPGQYRNSHAFKFWFDNTFTIKEQL